jgi:uncharacterized protein (DUF488 family)
MTLFTIGYEKRTLAEFLDILAENGISAVVDIRAIPYSRRKDLCKKALAEKLTEIGIEYVHLGRLGSPKELRDKVRNDGDYDYFFKEYQRYLDEQTETLKALLDLAGRKTVCLLCYERDVNQCHRRAVADKLSKMADGESEILHI